ncbi:MAG: PQQ-binding-like beta-propeller repeat protein [Planctomycetota bacterium]
MRIWICAWLLLSGTAFGQDIDTASTSDSWTQFRGPRGLGVAAPGAKLPLPFGLEQNVLWKVGVPEGFSSPCILGKRLFLTGWKGEDLLYFALNTESGETLWSRSVKRQGAEQFEHKVSGPAMPTPCTDGERVYFYFGSYGLIATTIDGELVWEKKLPIPKSSFGTATSPILDGGHLIVVRDGCPEAAVLGLDPKTGEVSFEIPRTGFIESYTSPFVWQNDKRRELVVAGSRTLRSYDLGSGEQLWEVSNTALFVCPTPVATEQMLIFAAWNTMNAEGRERIESIVPVGFELTEDEVSDGERFFARFDENEDGKIEKSELPESRARDAFDNVDGNKDGFLTAGEIVPFFKLGRLPGRNILVAVRPGGEGDISESHVAWTRKRGLPYVASPLIHHGRLYLMKAGGEISCLAPETGKAFFERVRLPDHGEYYASPIGVGNHIVIGADSGRLFVLKASNELDIVQDIDLGEELVATPAAIGNRLYVRTAKTMWAFAEK